MIVFGFVLVLGTSVKSSSGWPFFIVMFLYSYVGKCGVGLHHVKSPLIFNAVDSVAQLLPACQPAGDMCWIILSAKDRADVNRERLRWGKSETCEKEK